MVQVPSERHLAELRTDLQVERTKLAVLVESLAALQRALDVPEGADWQRRLLDRMTVPTEVRPALLDAATAKGLAELMRFRHVVWHWYANELEPEQVQRLLRRALELWPIVDHQLVAFDTWLQALAQ